VRLCTHVAWRAAEARPEKPIEVRNVRKSCPQSDIKNATFAVMRRQQCEGTLQPKFGHVGGECYSHRLQQTYFPGMIRIPEGSAPDFKNKSWTIAAEVTIPQGGANGVLGTIGGRYGGWALLLMDGMPMFTYALSNQPQHKYRVASDQPLAPGNHILRVKFDYDGGGIGKGATATLLVDEKQMAQGRIDKTVGVRFSLDETFDIGQDTGTPVLEEYESKMPFPFTGALTKFVVVLQPQNLSEDERQRLRQELAKALMAVQ
jgi:hypothetical protein